MLDERKAMRYPLMSYGKGLESAKQHREREQKDLELTTEMADDMDFNFLSVMLSGLIYLVEYIAKHGLNKLDPRPCAVHKYTSLTDISGSYELYDFYAPSINNSYVKM
uniref:Uncharacterized protein n=1 Tax=Glossina brevipalpis TaxID=37001 RepID=A0A1A9WUJ3_9MUSC